MLHKSSANIYIYTHTLTHIYVKVTIIKIIADDLQNNMFRHD